MDLTARRPEIIRYELQHETLVAVERAAGHERLEPTRPFPYDVVAADLLG